MENELVIKLEKSIEKIKDKSFRIYFFVQETKGNAKASIRYIYDFALALQKNGYNAIMLTEKPDYTPITSWLSEEYETLPHQPIEGGSLAISPEDLLIIPEIFGFIMEQVKNLPCSKIVIAQAYDHVLETLEPGASWSDYGFFKCITTSENAKNQISKIMRNVSYDIVEPFISEAFVEQVLPPKPIIGIHSREQREGINLIKEFYLRFPQYRWITFRDLRGTTEHDFANLLKESFLSVWIDPTSTWGSFPLESMKVGVPVVGQIPKLRHDWMTEENGIWVENTNNLTDIVADFVLNWLEDNITPTLVDEGRKTAQRFSSREVFDNKVIETISNITSSRLANFEEQLNRIKETNE
jgi:hypothetical protein